MISLLRLSAKMCLKPTRRTDLSTRNNSFYTAARETGLVSIFLLQATLTTTYNLLTVSQIAGQSQPIKAI